jgi:hypothetical protein
MNLTQAGRMRSYCSSRVPCDWKRHTTRPMTAELVLADFVAEVGDLSRWASVGLLRPCLVIRRLGSSASYFHYEH